MSPTTLAFRAFVLSVVLAAVLDMLISQKLRPRTTRLTGPHAWWALAGPVRLLLGPTAAEFMRSRTFLFPVTELLFGGGVLLALRVLGPGPQFARAVIFLLLAVPLLVIPALAEHAWTPSALTYPGIAAGIASGTLLGADGLVSVCVAAGAAAAVMVGLFLLRPDAIGLGAVKATVLVGAFCGWPGAAAAYAAAIAMAMLTTLALLLAGRVTGESQIPLTPFLMAGGFTALLCLPPG
ncbi:hypothetical protein AGRA3207_002130 [Actinomadura graeca]|uniref:Prepilin peptidase n=1 Tax=Actinomadura graeca TaxID=2750812 RepID=A0ABX8QU75_9ACTN|nr:hypothetical protein [Actinomadura graeca]QXJ21292.1 hypothetical protein AGRA3207_002130 [Actinomadura graeca]